MKGTQVSPQPLIVDYDLVTSSLILIGVILVLQILRTDKLIYKVLFFAIAIVLFGTGLL